MRRRRIVRLTLLVLLLALAAGGVTLYLGLWELPEALRYENWPEALHVENWERPSWLRFEGLENLQLPGVIRDMMFWRQEEETAEPTPTPEPTPSPEPELDGVAAEAQTFLAAVRDGDGETVERYGGGVPGYIGEGEFSTATLRSFYRAVYGSLSWRFGAVSESLVAGTVEAEITARDMRVVLEEMTARTAALAAEGGFASLDDAERTAALDGLLSACLAEESVFVTRKVILTLRLQEDEWRVTPSSPLSAALSGGASTALPDFALPPLEAESAALDEEERSVNLRLLANNYAELTVTQVRPNAPEGYSLDVTVTNRLGQSAVFSARSVVVNGFVLSPDWSVTVPAHATVQSSIVWDRAALTRCGITQVNDIRFTLDLYEKPAWPVYPLHSQPCQLQLSRSTQSDPRLIQGERQILLSEEASPLSILSARSLGSWGYELTLYLANNSGRELWFALGDVAVNGRELDPLWSETLPSGTAAVETVTFPAGQLLLNGVGAVEELDCILYVSTLDDLDRADRAYSVTRRFVLDAAELSAPEAAESERTEEAADE